MRNFWTGFAVCYLIAGVVHAKLALEIPATTAIGAVYIGATWLPLMAVPTEMLPRLTPAWVFSTKPENDGKQ